MLTNGHMETHVMQQKYSEKKNVPRFQKINLFLLVKPHTSYQSDTT